MSIFKINPTDYQTVTVATKPFRSYISSSIGGVTGSIFVYPRRSPIEKEITPADEKEEGWFNDSSLQIESDHLLSAYNQSPNIYNVFSNYLNSVNQSEFSKRKSKSLDISRFTPSPFTQTLNNVEDFSKNFYKKLTIRESLSPYYKASYQNLNWGYINYNSINFFSASTGNDSPAIVYPNYDDQQVVHDGHSTGIYMPSGAISFDLHVNPRYNYLDDQGHFRAGTIFHLSSSYALSLITGSLKDQNGLPAAFKLMLQLSHSADIPPSKAVPGAYPNDLIFISEDNILNHNNWHHVVVRWGTNIINLGTGSFIVDGVQKGTFYVNSGTIAPKSFADNATDPANPDALFFGNYYEGTNAGNDRLKKFFTNVASSSYGCYEMDPATDRVQPDNFSCVHPLRAEIHHATIKMSFMSDKDVTNPNSNASITETTAFYLPPYFKEETPIRVFDNTWPTSGVPRTVKENETRTTADPFNSPLAFGTDGHYINIENYLVDFVHPVFLPRLVNLTHTPIVNEIQGYTANDHLYDQHEVRARNLLILPCDDGKHVPSFEVIKKDKLKNLYADDDGFLFIDYVNLSKIIVPSPTLLLNKMSLPTEEPTTTLEQPYSLGTSATKIYEMGQVYTDSYLDYFNTVILKKSNPKEVADFFRQAPLYVSERTKDGSSNQVTFFDISNLFYGMKISPNTFTITDSELSGSEGKISVTIKDDGLGGLYRADCLTEACKWNNVGTIFYNEGIIAIKNPHLYFFGKEQFEMSFKGEQNIHVMRLDVVAPSNQLISSSNPSFRILPSTNNPNEHDSKFVYITGINFHDDNLNVVMKTQLAQPIMKRHSDKIAFKVKYDW